MSQTQTSAYVLLPDGSKALLDGKGRYHTEDFRPSLIKAKGDKMWHTHGELDRKSGPAVERADKTCKWYREGKLHRVEGSSQNPLDAQPAVIYTTGAVEYHVCGHMVHKDVADEMLHILALKGSV